MLDSNRFLAVIPARGGSKAVPRKNIRALGGKPLLITPWNRSPRFRKSIAAVVSTDDPRVADIASGVGGEVLSSCRAGDRHGADGMGAAARARYARGQGRNLRLRHGARAHVAVSFAGDDRRCMRRRRSRPRPSLMTVTETRGQYRSARDGVSARWCRARRGGGRSRSRSTLRAARSILPASII